MRVFINLFFLTLVLLAFPAGAAPDTNIQLTPAPLDSSPINSPIWPRDVSPYNLAIYGGFSGGNIFENDETVALSALGLRFSYDSDLDHAWDYNAEIDLPDNLIGIHFGRRNFIYSPSELMPYYKWGFGTHLKGSDGLSNFVEIKRWQARLSVGVGNLFHLDQHLYMEGGLGAAVVGLEYFAGLGVNFNL